MANLQTECCFIEQTPCGKWLEAKNLYASSSLTRPEANKVWATASVKYAQEVSGSCRCFIANAPKKRVFRSHEFSTLLNNDRVTHLNNIPRQALKDIYDKDPDAAFSALSTGDEALRKAEQEEKKKKDSGSKVASAAQAASAADGSGGGGGGLPAARLSDMHVCPMVTGVVPHEGGPIAVGCPTVLIGGLPAARMGDMATCVGPPDTIAAGSSKVLIGGQPAARVGGSCAHGGAIVLGCFTVLVG